MVDLADIVGGRAVGAAVGAAVGTFDLEAVPAGTFDLEAVPAGTFDLEAVPAGTFEAVLVADTVARIDLDTAMNLSQRTHLLDDGGDGGSSLAAGTVRQELD